MSCTTVTNFCSKGKVMLLLSVVRYQVLLYLDTTIWTLLHVLSYKSAAGSGLFKV